MSMFRFIANLLISLRLKHWVKNGFIFIPLIFAGLFFDSLSFLKVLKTFLIFCLIASSVYLLNDVLDKERDKNHPQKKKRPIAKGDISVFSAMFLSFLFLIISLFWSYYLDRGLILFIGAYYLFNVLYSLFLKNLFLLDVFSITLNYLIRIYAGAYVLSLEVSHWLFLVIFLFSLVVSFGKRREELSFLNESAKIHRKSLEFYTNDLLKQMIIVTSTLTIICFILYTVSPDTIIKHGNYLVYSSPLVVFGFLRYLYLVENKKIGSPIEVIFEDREIFLTIIIWFLTIIFLIYFIK